MKTTLLITLFAGAVASAQSQDFRAVPPAEQPNAADLAYFGSKHPNLAIGEPQNKEAVSLVTGFLNDLCKGQFESAHKRLADGFAAYGPNYDDKLEADDLLEQWDRNAQRYSNQQLTIESTSTTLVPTGNNQGQWVYVKAIWSAVDGRGQGNPVRISFHELARVSNGQIERTYTSYGADQLFYDLGFALYASPSGTTQRR